MNNKVIHSHNLIMCLEGPGVNVQVRRYSISRETKYNDSTKIVTLEWGPPPLANEVGKIYLFLNLFFYFFSGILARGTPEDQADLTRLGFSYVRYNIGF